MPISPHRGCERAAMARIVVLANKGEHEKLSIYLMSCYHKPSIPIWRKRGKEKDLIWLIECGYSSSILTHKRRLERNPILAVRLNRRRFAVL